MAGTTAAAPGLDLELHAAPYAGIATRAIAFAIDVVIAQLLGLIAYGFLFVVQSVFGSVNFSTADKLLAAGGWALMVSVYFVGFWSFLGQTPGMQIMRIRVLDPAGGRPSLGRSLVRGIGLLLCMAPFFAGFLTVLFDGRRRGLHDMAAGTVVVYSGPVAQP